MQTCQFLVSHCWCSRRSNLCYSIIKIYLIVSECDDQLLLTLLFSKRIGDISKPSRVTFGSGAPTNFITVGKRSTVAPSYVIHHQDVDQLQYSIAICLCIQICSTSVVLPGWIFPGQWAIPGTLWPPSHVVPLPHRRSPALPPRILLVSEGLKIMHRT